MMFDKAQNTLIQGSSISLTAVGRDQHIEVKDGPAFTGGILNVAGDQHNYNTVPLKGIDLLHHHCAPDALLNANARLDQPQCMPGTRQAIIKEIVDWVKSEPHSSSMSVWLQGPAGAGKTAIEHTIAAVCQKEGLLIGSFFFSRAVTNCTNGNLLIPTLANQLAAAIPQTRRYIVKALRKDPHLFTKTRETQMKALIVEPIKCLSLFRWLQHKLGLRPFPRLIAIDGLDECSDRDVQRDILKIFVEACQTLQFPLRIIIASRPEPHISRAIEDLRSTPSLVISDISLKEDALARRDIKLFFETKFAEVRRLHSEVPEIWPTPETISRLVDKASGQFVYASTVMAYITSQYHRPDDRLQVILLLYSPPSTDKPFAQLDCLYLFILRSATHRQDILRIMALLIAAKGVPEEEYNLEGVDTFPSIPRIESLLQLRQGDVRRILTDMHSLVDCQHDSGIKMLHASFPDFLTNQLRSEELCIDLNEADKMFHRCLVLEGLERLSNLNFALLVAQHPYQRADFAKSPFPSVLKACEGVGLVKEFKSTLENLNLFGQYKDFMHVNPWMRASATAVLRLYVTDITASHCISYLETFSHTSQPHYMQKYLGTSFDLDAKLCLFWGQYHWGQYETPDRVHHRYIAAHYLLSGSVPDIERFLGYLLSKPPGRELSFQGQDCYIPMYEKPGNVTLKFYLEQWHARDSPFKVEYDDSRQPRRTPYIVDLKALHALQTTRSEVQEAWAWQILEDSEAYFMPYSWQPVSSPNVPLVSFE